MYLLRLNNSIEKLLLWKWERSIIPIRLILLLTLFSPPISPLACKNGKKIFLTLDQYFPVEYAYFIVTAE